MNNNPIHKCGTQVEQAPFRWGLPPGVNRGSYDWYCPTCKDVYVDQELETLEDRSKTLDDVLALLEHTMSIKDKRIKELEEIIKEKDRLIDHMNKT